MTCIIGIVKDGEMIIGGDSAGISGRDLELRKDPKVFRLGEFILGYTTSFRMGQLLMFGFNPPEQKSKQTDFEYLCTDFIDALRKRLKDGGYSTIKDNVEAGGTFIIGYRGNIYKIDSDFQIAQPISNFTACGCGESFALGAIYALVETELTLEQIVKRALEITQQLSTGVREPFILVK